MSVESLREKLPEYSKDLKLNLSSLMRSNELNDEQRWGTLVSCAAATKSKELCSELFPEAKEHLSAEAFEAALGASAIMGMNNIYYRFTHVASNPKYSQMRAGLRMNVIRNSGVDSKLFELWSLAVSAINGCSMCVDSHERQLKEHGVTEEEILDAVRIASVVHAIAGVLSAEAGRA